MLYISLGFRIVKLTMKKLSGIYCFDLNSRLYTLILDGVPAGTKKLVVIK